MSIPRTRPRRPATAAVALLGGLFFTVQLPVAAGGDAGKIAWEYKFTSMPIAMPPGYHLVDPEWTT